MFKSVWSVLIEKMHRWWCAGNVEGLLTGIVNDVLHNTLDVSMALGVVEVAELGRSLVETGDGRCSLVSIAVVDVDVDFFEVN